MTALRKQLVAVEVAVWISAGIISTVFSTEGALKTGKKQPNEPRGS